MVMFAVEINGLFLNLNRISELAPKNAKRGAL